MVDDSMLDRSDAERLYAAEGVSLTEAKRLRRRAKADGWRVVLNYRCHTGTYDVRVFGRGEPEPAA